MASASKYMFLQMAKRYIKKSLVTKHQTMEIKTKERYHLTSISMAIVKKKNNNNKRHVLAKIQKN